MTTLTRTHAFNQNRLLKDVLEMSDKENTAYLLDFLYTHALNWATKQYSMTPGNAGKYATWYVGIFGKEWVNDVTAPPHSGWTIFKYARSLAHERNEN